MPSLLIVEDEPVLAQNLVKAFAGQGFDVEVAGRIADARKLAATRLPDVALLDFRLPDGSGLDLLAALVREDPELPVIMMTGYGSVADAVRAMQQGARDYVQKPLDLSELRLKVEQALRSRRERREISYYRGRGAAPGDILGESTTTPRLRTLVARVTAPLQSKFLNVIEEKVVRRIGATAGRRVDVQVIAATSRDLEAAVRLGEFREDLFQRLSVAVIRIPPLREREGDAVVLARTFLADTCRRYGQPLRTLSAAAVETIARYPWPGNVREVANTIERAVLFSDENPLPAEDLALPSTVPPEGAIRVSPSGEVLIDFPDGGLSLEAVERALLVRALEKAGGNQSAAARLLGISRDTLRYRMEKYGLVE